MSMSDNKAMDNGLEAGLLVVMTSLLRLIPRATLKVPPCFVIGIWTTGGGTGVVLRA